ncbi:MAG TPA: tetratricopeptide repeat protein [Candidatus Limnocylindrales bacterium]|nr:tetratricopeptide repeat protein [Candidatus Limnocylindrales bacterium]
MKKTATNTVAVVAPASPWIYTPWLDLLVGCGAWSAPLLAVAMWLTPLYAHGWAVGFYLLAIIFNYPHFMATVYRAYHTREDFEKYKIFTLHVTLLLVLTGVLLHASYQLLPWVFTLYICWSPWHYTGQNYGLMMMFARRSGASISQRERRWLRAAFVASFLMLLASFETGGSSDPLILSLGLPAKITLPARVLFGSAFALFAFLGFRRLVREHGISKMIAPLTLLLTQFLWFVLPTLIELRSSYQIPQTRYSSGILAVMHSAQYIWITSYYQQREARAAGQSRWPMTAYFATLVAGGIALFIPGPWLVSYIFRYDFTTSFLIFTALVNIHHFILDGAIWKLRDARVGSLLVGQAKTQSATAVAKPVVAKSPASSKSWGWGILSAPAFRISLAALLFLWGGIDQIHFALGTDNGNLAALESAASMNPYDSELEARIASAETHDGRSDEAIAALTQAVEINPRNAGLQHACARALIENGRYEEAYERYGKMLKIFPSDGDALVNYGLLAARLGHPDEALSSWQKAAESNPPQPNAHLYLAEAMDQKRDFAGAIPHWQTFLQLAVAHPDDPAATPTARISAQIQLGDDEALSGDNSGSLSRFQSAIAAAEQAGDLKLESLALAHMADLQEKMGNAKEAAAAYQRALGLDPRIGDVRSEAFDWFNYGQFLRRHAQSDELAYACILKAADMLSKIASADLQTVEPVLRESEKRLGGKVPQARKDLPELLARAASLPENSF